MTAPASSSVPRPLRAVAGAAEQVLTRLAAGVLPWSQRSQHDSYLEGYKDGLRDGLARSTP